MKLTAAFGARSLSAWRQVALMRPSLGLYAATTLKVRCMAKLIYSMLTSSDGYTEDERGKFGWALPDAISLA